MGLVGLRATGLPGHGLLIGEHSSQERRAILQAELNLDHIGQMAATSLAKHEATLLWDHPDSSGREHAVRAWRFAAPGTSNMAMTIYVVPGRIIMVGDAGELILQRCTDMVGWLRGAIKSPGYVLEKVPHSFQKKHASYVKALIWIKELRAESKDSGKPLAKKKQFDEWERQLDGAGEHEVREVVSEIYGMGLTGYDYPDVDDFTPNLCWCYWILKRWLEVADPQPLEPLPADVR